MNFRPSPALLRRALGVALLLAPWMALAGPPRVMGPKNTPLPAQVIAPPADFIQDGKTVPLAMFKGKKLMIWQVATWCGSCQAGLRVFERQRAVIDHSDLTVLVLRDYKNGGYPGATIQRFVQRAAPGLLHDRHFVFGDASRTLNQLYNPHHYVDIYDLITPGGKIAVQSSAPSATFGKIKAFIARPVS
jgi:thiol-disulfide isomerase/thioredoxin